MRLTDSSVANKFITLRPIHKTIFFFLKYLKSPFLALCSSLKVDNETQSSQINFHIVSVAVFGLQAITILSSSKISLPPSQFFFFSNFMGFCTSYFKENSFFYRTYIEAHFKYLLSLL